MLKPGTGSRPISASPMRSRVLEVPLITYDAIIEQIFLLFIEYKGIILTTKLFLPYEYIYFECKYKYRT